MKFKWLSGIAMTALLATMGTASAYVINGQPVPPGTIPFTVQDLGTSGSQGFVSDNPITADGETISFVAGSGSLSSGEYAGNTTNVALSPFGSGNSTNNYLVAQPGGGSVTISFATSQTAFDLVWGTVDTNPVNYNQLTFEVGGQTITGEDIFNAIPGITPGTTNVAVEITGLDPFTTITATAADVAFEFAPGVPVPEPGSLALLGTGILAFGMAGFAVRRRRQG